VEILLDGRKPHLMVTDPPYGVNYDPDWRNHAARNSTAGMGNRKIGAGAIGKVKNDDRADWRVAWELFPGVVAYVWHAGKFAAEVATSLSAAKFIVRSQLVWVKSHFAIGRGDYHWGHEPAYYATKQGSFDDHWRFEEEHELAAYAVKLGEKAEWRGGRKQSTVWEINMVKNDTGHGTQKPVECMLRPILNNSGGGDLVYDPFLGSGTTVIAAHKSGRVCLGLELDPVYVDVIVQRWATFTGGVPIHLATGKTMAELKADRHGKKTAAAAGEPKLIKSTSGARPKSRAGARA
jgi:DNA modification methylase